MSETSQWFAQWAMLNPAAADALRYTLLANAGGGRMVYLPMPAGRRMLYRFPETSQVPALERPAPVSFDDPTAGAAHAAARRNFMQAARALLSGDSSQSDPASCLDGAATSPACAEACTAPASGRGEA